MLFDMGNKAERKPSLEEYFTKQELDGPKTPSGYPFREPQIHKRPPFRPSRGHGKTSQG